MTPLMTYVFIAIALFGWAGLNAFVTHLCWRSYHREQLEQLADQNADRDADLALLCREEKEQAVRAAIARVRNECQQGNEQEVAMHAEQSKQFYDMKEDVDKIALFLRENYKKEIDQGFHSGRGLGTIVIGYLGREKEQRRLFNEASQQRAVAAAQQTAMLNEGRD